MKNVTINITGDLYCEKSSQFNIQPMISDNVLKLFSKSDINIVNLEAPITSSKYKINKTGPHLKHSNKVFEILNKLNVNIVTLANNHLMDYGNLGFSDTIDAITKNNIDFVGAGINSNIASKPLIISKNGIKIGIVNICENEWSISSEDNPGANPIDLIDNTKQIQNTKKISDFLMVIIHGGHEYYNLPSPRMAKLYRYFADLGANIVIGHHPHCISGFEIYNGTPIFYSLGNFIFTKKSKYESWYTGLVLQIYLEKKTEVRWKLIPVAQSRSNYSLTIPDKEKKAKILSEVDSLSKIIVNENALSKEWRSFISMRKSSYLQSISITNSFSNRYIRAIFRKTGIMKLTFSKRLLNYYMNLLQCESHNDLAKEVIKDYIVKKNKN